MNYNYRRAHKKTRTGCSQCKKRKIKCDESKPSCKNCSRHSYQCNFAACPPSSGAQGIAPATPDSTQSPCHIKASPPETSRAAQPLPFRLYELNLIDLELLHNYSTSTCLTMSNNLTIRNLWRITVPQIAFKHTFVMRSMLAISALHLAYFNPTKREIYLEQALVHQEIGLHEVSGILPSLSDANASAIYIFSAFTAISALASPHKRGEAITGNGSPYDMGGWFSMFRGVRVVIEASSHALYDGLLGPLFRAGTRRTECLGNMLEVPDNEYITELRRLVKQSTLDLETHRIYASAIDTIQQAMDFVNRSPAEHREGTDPLVWLYEVNHEYLSLLSQKKQEALAIFGFSSVLFKNVDSQWWVEGCAVHVIAGTYRLLDEEHRLWIRWPIEEIGWIPTESDINP